MCMQYHFALAALLSPPLFNKRHTSSLQSQMSSATATIRKRNQKNTVSKSTPSSTSTLSATPTNTILLDQTSTKKGFIGSAMSSASSMASSVAGTAMNSMYDKPCVMCEYILEQVDKMIKAQPRMMNGNGYYPGVMDFGGGVQQGNYRTYQGTYLEVGEKNSRKSRRGERRNLPIKLTKESATTSATPTSTEKGKSSPLHRSTSNVQFGPVNGAKRNLKQNNRHAPPVGRFTHEQRKAALSRFQEKLKIGIKEKLITSKSLLFTSTGSTTAKVSKGGSKGDSKGGSKGGATGFDINRATTGRHTFKDVDLTDDQVEKDQEFATMYKDFMDAMDDVCFHDFPKDYQQYCKNMYYYGDRVVEMYLHDYDDFEICAQTPLQCIPTWFDEGAKSLWRR
jgi:hypothetical protein